MLYRETFTELEPAREYAVRVNKSDAPPFEFDISQSELDELNAGKAIVLVVGHEQTDSCAVVLTRNE